MEGDSWTDSPPKPESIEGFRERVDEVDRSLMHLLNERARVVQGIARLKREAGIPPFDPRREEKILRRIAKENEGPIYDTSMREIFRLILHRIRDLEVQREEFSR